MAASTWTSLPTEMKLAVIDNLDSQDVGALSRVDVRSYNACVPSLFRKVKLDTYEALEQFLEDVPRAYCTYIEELYLCTANRDMHSTPVLPRVRADAVIAMLSATPRLAKLALTTHGSLDKSVLSPFPYLSNLRQLSIANCGDEKLNPLSERLAVAIALAVQNLEVLCLDRITRSKLHATELNGRYTHVPLALNDSDIPQHPLIGSDLSLPSLLRIPTLRQLTIRDTHLGDPRWQTMEVACRLEVLDLGSCYHEDEGFNTRCTERIMAAVGPTVDEFSLTAAVSDSSLFGKPQTPLSRLRKLHISPFFPIDSVVDTVSNLAGSPVERISVQCFEEDVVDVCGAIEEFLSLRVERGPEFYHKLQQIDVAVTTSADDDEDEDGLSSPSEEEIRERNAAAQRLQDFCRDLQLASVVGKFNKKVGQAGGHIGGASIAHKMDVFARPVKSMESITSFTDAKRFHTKSRSMTL